MLKKIFITNVCFLLLVTMANNASGEETEEGLNLDTIVITASKVKQNYKNITTNISTLTTKDIKNSGVTEATQLLDTLPSLDVLEYGSFGSTKHVHLRGTSAAQSLVLINGRPITTPRDGLADLNQIPLSNVERIEVIRGPAAAMYGANAVGGVINIITKTGSKTMQTELVNKYGSHQTKFVSFSNGYKINNLDYFLSYDYLTSDGDRDHNFYRSNNPNINLGYQIDKDNRISFLSGFYKSMGGSPGQATHADLDDRQSNDKKFFDLTWEGKIFQKQDILLKIYHNIDRLEFMEAYDPDNLVYKQKDTHQTKVYGLDMQFSQSLSDGLRLALGTNYQIHNLNSSTSAKHEYNLKAFYWEAEATLLDGLTWKLGARWDDYSNFADKISPSTSFALWLWDKVKLHGLIGKSFRAPTFNDLYWPREDWGIWGGVEGSSTLRPEKATSYELGMGGYLFKRLNADLTAFITECKDLIEWTMDDTLWWRPTNIGSAKIKGIEFESGYNIFENTKLSLNYTYLDARDKDTDKWLIYRPRSYYKIKLTYIPIEKLKIDLAGKYKTKRFSDKDNTKALSSYFTLDSDMVYKVNDNTEILLSVNNIFDRYYEEEGDYPMPGLNIMAGFRKKF